MTMPEQAIPEVKAYTLKPTSTAAGYLQRTDGSAQSVPLPEGVNVIQVAWMGDSEITVNHRNIANLTTTLPVSIPAAGSARKSRNLVFTVPVPEGTDGELLFIRATAPTQWDVDRVVCGVTVINQPS